MTPVAEYEHILLREHQLAVNAGLAHRHDVVDVRGVGTADLAYIAPLKAHPPNHGLVTAQVFDRHNLHLAPQVPATVVAHKPLDLAPPVIPPLSNLTLQRLGPQLIVVRTDGLRVVKFCDGDLWHVITERRS